MFSSILEGDAGSSLLEGDSELFNTNTPSQPPKPATQPSVAKTEVRYCVAIFINLNFCVFLIALGSD